MNVYNGRRDVYGRQSVRVWIDKATGQAESEAAWARVSEPLTDAVIDAHLARRLTVGVYVLHADSSCWFAVWDVDSRDRAPVTLIERALDEWEIDFLTFDSGRKGYHIVAAFAEAITGEIAYRFTQSIWEQAGKPEHVDRFPRQGVLTAERPFGNLIKLPLGLHRDTGRICALLNRDCEPLVEGQEEDELAGLRRVPLPTIMKVAGQVATVAAPAHKPSSNGVTASGFVHVPYPCFASLSTARYPSGQRDTLLFTLTKHLVNQGQPRAFAELVVERQAERCIDEGGRPAPFRDWEAKVESVYSHGYTSFGCEEPAMEAFCAGAVCPLYQRQHGSEASAEGSDEEDGPQSDAPEGRIVRLEDLVQIGQLDPEYELTVNGRRITNVDRDTLHAWPKFKKHVAGVLRFIPALPSVKGERPQEVWETLLNAALESSTLEERPGDASGDAEVMQSTLDYLTNGVDVSETRADVLRGAVWDHSDEDGTVWRYFLGKHVLTAIRMRVGGVTQRALYGVLRRHGVQGINVTVEGQTKWMWRIPRHELEERMFG